MVKRIALQAHLSTSELERRYRRAQDPVERTHYQIIWWLAQGQRTSDVMAVTGYSRKWVQEVARRYNRQGPPGLGDGRHRNPGGAPLLDAAAQQELVGALGGDAPDGGLWSGPKVAAWIGARLGRRVHVRRGWDYLRRLRYSPQVPRPAHAEADAAAQAAFPQG